MGSSDELILSAFPESMPSDRLYDLHAILIPAPKSAIASLRNLNIEGTMFLRLLRLSFK
jgi:hypothetical protein